MSGSLFNIAFVKCESETVFFVMVQMMMMPPQQGRSQQTPLNLPKLFRREWQQGTLQNWRRLAGKNVNLYFLVNLTACKLKKQNFTLNFGVTL